MADRNQNWKDVERKEVPAAGADTEAVRRLC